MITRLIRLLEGNKTRDFATGELELNALLRNGTEKSWENKYGSKIALTSSSTAIVELQNVF